jgi:general L-amino acid transport system permease protein
MTSQYLNLTKNSSLAIAVAYPDLFYVASTINNQTGQAVPVILMLMVSYLSVSLITSLLMNWYNRRIQLVER